MLVLNIIALAATAFAIPASWSAAPLEPAQPAPVTDMTVVEASQQCGNGQVISCCNTKKGMDNDEISSKWLAAESLLGGNCEQVNLMSEYCRRGKGSC